MVTGVCPPPSRLGPGPGPDPDHLPLAERRRRLLWPPLASWVETSPPAPDRCEASAAAEGSGGAAGQSWPGLPRGAQFNPSDSDLLWHLAAEVGNGLASRHPFINEFIKSVEEDRVFGCTHPQDIPGVRQDGRASYFFHKKFKLYNNENDKYISWQKSGTPRSIILDGSLRGCKEVFVLYAYKTNDSSPQRTDWRLHQYHIKNTMKDEEELVVSKIFYKSQKNRCEWGGKAPAQSAQGASATDIDFKEDVQLENHSANIATESNFAEGNGNNQEQVQMETYPDQDKLSSCKDVLDTTHINHENQINNHAETELDHISLQERYIIRLAGKHSCSARVSVGKCVMNDTANSCRQMGAETSESEEICRNHEGTAYKEDICSMLQQISSVQSIIDSAGNDNMMLMGKVPPDTQISQMECFVDSYDYRAELLSSPTPTCGNENIQSSARNSETVLVGVKLEPALEGYEIYPSESPRVKSHHSSKNGGLENTGSVPECLSKDSETDFELLHDMGDLAEKTSADSACSKQSTDPKHVVEGCSLVRSKNSVSSDICKIISAAASSQAKITHAEGPLPSLGVKSELTGSELPGLCENNSINIAEPIVKTTHTRTLNRDGGPAYCSRQRKKRKMEMNSSEKAFEEDAYRNDEGIAYCSRRRRRKKTATDSIEQALEEDAPGLLQILLDRGVMVQEIKLYGVEEDNEMLPDFTESDFQDLENVITKLFPQRASLLKSAARHAKGEKAMYCLACLISLIEQSRYLQFRDCPVEWGWCRDLQSFVFVFRSHNRIVLERPEYGYATYFFEIVQSLPIEWQILRLVTAMKLSSSGRTALIENRSLLVGEDLTEGEAQVLEEYGWIPKTGLGTMLNFCDRVVHDRWNEKCSTDWRTKIGKLLMAGYSEGQLITTHIPTKVGTLTEDTEIKLEDPF